MRIGFDAKRAFLNNTGLGNYSRTLIQSMADAYSQEAYFLYAPTLPKNDKTNIFFDSKYTLRCAPNAVLKSIWRSRLMVGQLAKDKLDIYHGLSHELPVGLDKTGIKSVVTIHDLIFLRYPDLYPFIDRKIYAAKIKYACAYADVIIAISEQTKRDIARFLNVPSDKIKVIYQSCAASFRKQYMPGAIAAVREKYGLPEQFLLSVGTIEERKNLLLIAKALKRLPVHIKCVVIGKKTKYFDRVQHFLEQENLTGRMIFLPQIPFSELPQIYRAATIFVYVSRFEGFGIPVIEALCSETPVIAATGSCLEEAGGPDSLYVSPDDDNDLAQKIVKILDADALAKKMAEKGKTYAMRFLPENITTELMQLYQSLVKN